MDQQALKKFVEDNPKLVSMNPAGDGIYVLKYKRTVFYNNLWNDFLENCRGTIVDADFNVITRPFQKIFNYGIEKKAPKFSDDTEITAYRKVNGFMISMTWHAGDILLSTTGSTSNDYTGYAKEMMLTHQSWADWQMAVLGARGATLLFECCHPSDPHIVPEDAGMYFLGIRDNTWHSTVKMFGSEMTEWVKDFATHTLKCKYAVGEQTTVGELIAAMKSCKHEGYVLYSKDGQATKIKSQHYLTAKWVARNPKTEKLLTKEFKEQIDEEYYPLLTYLQNNISIYTEMDEQERLKFVRGFLE